MDSGIADDAKLPSYTSFSLAYIKEIPTWLLMMWHTINILALTGHMHKVYDYKWHNVFNWNQVPEHSLYKWASWDANIFSSTF